MGVDVIEIIEKKYKCSVCDEIYPSFAEAHKCFNSGFLGPDIKKGLIVRNESYLGKKINYPVFVNETEQFS